jgi:RNA 2',3'-cyclic 3'-phosphodiesterase
MRLFVGIDIEPEIRERLARFVDGVQGFAPDARWVRPETFHVTLKFIGEVAELKVDSVKSALASVRGTATQISFRGAGFFPTPRSARVFWIGIEADDNLRALAASVDTALSGATSLGIEPERQPYTPHLTLARASQRSSRSPHQKPRPGGRAFERLQEKLGALPAPDFGTMTAREFFLFESKLSPAGARYSKIARYGLE